MAKTIRTLGERNELVMMSRNLVPWLITLAIFAHIGKDSLINFIAFKGATEVVGTVTGDEALSFSVNDEPVWRYFYDYTVNGNAYSGYSFSTKDIADKPPILISPFNPALSKIKGTSYSKLLGLGFWALVVPVLLMLLILVFRVRSLLRTRRFLRQGAFQDAELTDARESGKVNDEPRYNLTYTVKMPDGNTIETRKYGAAPGYPEKAQVLVIPGTEACKLYDSLDYHPTLETPERWAQPPVRMFMRSAIWLGAAFLLVAWAAIRVSLGITGG